MTDLQHDLIKSLSKRNCYLRVRMSHGGRWGYMLCEGNANPVRWYSEKTTKIIYELLKKDKDGKMTLNLNKVRQQHGKSLVKILYNKYKA